MLPPLRARFDELERQRRTLLDQVSTFSAQQRAFRPAPNTWSIADVLQHLVLVEEGTLLFLTKKPPRPDDRSVRQRARFRLFRFLATRDIRVKVPVPSVLPTSEASFEELHARWDAVRLNYERHLERIDAAQLPMLVFKHAFAGPLTIGETLEVLRLHILHHGHQLRRIRNASGFPADPAVAVPMGASA